MIYSVFRCKVYLVGFGVGGSLGIFCLFDIFHHFPDEGVAVVLVFGHDDLQDEPQSPEKEERFDVSMQNFPFKFLDIKLQMQFMSNDNN